MSKPQGIVSNLCGRYAVRRDDLGAEWPIDDRYGEIVSVRDGGHDTMLGIVGPSGMAGQVALSACRIESRPTCPCGSGSVSFLCDTCKKEACITCQHDRHLECLEARLKALREKL